MRRSSRTLISFAVATVCVAGPVALPATAAEPAPTGLAALQVAADAGIKAQVMHRASAGASPVPLEEVTVVVMRLDEAAGVYVTVDESQGTLSAGNYQSPALEPGIYVVRFLADPYSGIGSEYYADARYFYESTDITLVSGQTLDLGAVVLEPRYFDVGRLAGTTRFDTAVAVSRSMIPDGERAEVVYLADGLNFPDALAAGPAATRGGGVILTTNKTALPAVVEAELKRIKPLRVVIAGGTGAVSPAVMSRVQAILPGTPVTRLGGASRYETADLIVRDAFDDAGAGLAFIATGANYPDALAAGAAAGALDAPVILVDGARGLDTRTQATLTALGVTDVIITGGPTVVSTALENGLISLLGADGVTRLAGTSRYETAALVNAQLGLSDDAFVATGVGFADALAGGPLAGSLGAPLYLAPPTCLPPTAAVGLLEKQVAGVWLLGGPGALGTGVEQLALC